MTVKVTNGHGFCSDCDDTTGWTADSGLTVTCDGDAFTLQATPSLGTDEVWGYRKTVSPNLSTDVYKKAVVRFSTSASAAPGLQAAVKFVYTVGEEVFTLGFSSLLKTQILSLAAGKTLTEVQLLADDNPDSLASGTYTVVYDFLLVCKDQFVLPNTAGGVEFHPPARYGLAAPPMRVTDIIMAFGSPSAHVAINCDLSTGTWKRTNPADTLDGEVFLDISHNSKTEPFQWFDDGQGHKFKAILEEPVFRYDSAKPMLSLVFREYKLNGAQNETYVERFGINS